jgi:protein-tyrosine phosphatase
MVNRILIVCVGNICRSPTAEVMLRDRLRGKAIVVESAGLAALVGQPIDPIAEAVLARNGLTAAGHAARQLSQDMLSAADMVLAMDTRHISAIQALAPQARGKTFLLGRWQDDRPIPDPYGRDLTVFERTFGMIADAVDAWTTRL